MGPFPTQRYCLFRYNTNKCRQISHYIYIIMYKAPQTAPRHTAKVTTGCCTPRRSHRWKLHTEAAHLAGAKLALERERERESLFFFPIHREGQKKPQPSRGGSVVPFRHTLKRRPPCWLRGRALLLRHASLLSAYLPALRGRALRVPPLALRGGRPRYWPAPLGGWWGAIRFYPSRGPSRVPRARGALWGSAG